MLTWAIVYMIVKAKVSGNAGCLLGVSIVADVVIVAIVAVLVYFLFGAA